MRMRGGWLVAAALVGCAPLPAQDPAQGTWALGDQAWCERGGDGGRDAVRVCEVRTRTLASTEQLDIDAGPNGGIEVEGWSGSGIEVEARVSARARSAARADELLDAIALRAEGGSISAAGPETARRESWFVSFRVRVPRATDLDLETLNGGIDVTDVEGDIDFETTNGGVRLVGLAGDVRGRTRNGGVRVELAGDRWTGEGMDVRTTNGGVTVIVPEGYSAELLVGTTNGGVDIDFPVTVRGRVGRELRTTLGSGGSTIQAMTTNGGVRVVRR